MTTEDRLRALIARELGIEPDKVLLDARLVEDLGADSIDVVGLIMEIEDEFGTEITDDEMAQIKTVRDAALLIDVRAAAAAAPVA